MSIEKLKIPDDDMNGWINTLMEGGFSQGEIDSILSNLNKTYDNLKKQELIEKEVSRIDAELFNRRGSGLTDEE